MNSDRHHDFSESVANAGEVHNKHKNEGEEGQDFNLQPVSHRRRRDAVDTGTMSSSLSGCCARRKYRRFSVALSTEENFRVHVDEETPVFVGAFGIIRKKYLDHDNFHCFYRKERQWLHDSIIEECLEQSKEIDDDDADDDKVANQSGHEKHERFITGTQCHQVGSSSVRRHKNDADSSMWFILTVGVQGAGKHYTIRSLFEQGKFDCRSLFCLVDTDEIRRLLPEYESFVKAAPECVDACTDKEAGYIAETLCWAALFDGQSVIWDSSLRYPQWFLQHMGKLRSVFPQLQVAIIHITAPTPDTIHERRMKKAKVTKRNLVPNDFEFLQSEMDRIQRNVDGIHKQREQQIASGSKIDVDVLAVICNHPHHGLQLQYPDTWTWSDFTRSFFVQQKQDPMDFHPKLQKVPMISEISGNSDEETASTQPTTMSDFLPSGGSGSSLSTWNRSSHSADEGSRPLSKRCPGHCFSLFRSTEENYCSDDFNFYGRFAGIRASLDYNFHKNYTFGRQRFQDSVLEDFLQKVSITDKDGYVCTTPTEPWIVFTAGPMGAGKSYTMRHLVQKGRFPLMAFVNVDPDEIRRMLPEYHLYASLAPEKAGDLTRKEAGYLSEILTLAALRAGKNVLVDGSLRDADWYQDYFSRLRQEFPVLRLAIIQITAPKETILARAKGRAEETGRVVPETLLLEAYEQVPKSVEILQNYVDYHVTLHNPSDGFIQIMSPEDETWESFEARWVQ